MLFPFVRSVEIAHLEHTSPIVTTKVRPCAPGSGHHRLDDAFLLLFPTTLHLLHRCSPPRPVVTKARHRLSLAPGRATSRSNNATLPPHHLHGNNATTFYSRILATADTPASCGAQASSMSQLLMSPRPLLQISTLTHTRLPASLLSSTFLAPPGLRTTNRADVGALDGALKVEHLGGGRRRGSRAVTMAALPGLFPHADSVALSAMEFFLAVGGPLQAYSEASGKNMSYSKFASGGDGKKAMVSSKTGMFILYFPAALFAGIFLAYRGGLLPLSTVLESRGASGVASFLDQAVDASDVRLLLVSAALCIHFSKRVLEVLFVHKFSGSTSVGDTVTIGSSYLAQVCSLLYSQLLSAGLEAPSPDLKWLGVALFLLGITGNAYHHWMLSHLRKDGNTKYVVPRGGLFDVLVCPHYVFEMIDFVGIALISQTVFGWCVASFVVFYLTGRAIQTKQWYMKKVEGFPEDRSVLVPGIF